MTSDNQTPEVNAEVQPTAAAKPKNEKKQPNGTRLPFLLEFIYSIATLVLIFLALAVIITSYLAGASLFFIVLRTGVATIILGSLLIVIARQISSGLLFAVRIEQEEAEKKLNDDVTRSRDSGEGSLTRNVRDSHLPQTQVLGSVAPNAPSE